MKHGLFSRARIIPRILLGLIATSSVLLLGDLARALPLTSSDIAAMVQECPSLEEYKGTPAVIWSRKQLYMQDNQNRAVKTTSYVILCDATARFGSLEDQMIAPAGGRIELEQAAVFDPISSKLLQDIPYDKDELKHGRLVLRMPKVDDVYVLVLSYRQYFPTPGVLEDIAWIGAEYPTWEGSVQVRIANDQELLYESSTDTDPTTQTDGNFRRYGWFYFKQPANRGVRGMVQSADPYVIFSLQKGPTTAVAMMNDLASRQWGSIPEIYVEREGDVVTKDLKTVEKFWRSSSRLRGSGTWRSADMIPENGPWTTWEAAYVAAHWLEQRGWKAEVWFQHIIPQGRDTLSCAPGLEHPVLYVAEPHGKKSWFYVPGQPSEPRKLPVSLRGKTVYAAGTTRLRRKSLGGTHLEKNRLSIRWDLDVTPDCMVTGKLEVRVRNAWVEYFDDLAEGSTDLIYAMLDGLEGWLDTDGEVVVKPLGSQGFRLMLPVKARSGIEGVQGLMIALPSITPGPVLRLFDVVSSAVLSFPFVVEQEYKVSLPKGYRLLSTPLKLEQGSMVNTYSSQYRLNQRKNVLEGEEKLIQAVTRVEGADLNGFKRVMSVWGTWQNSSLALVPTGRAKQAKK